MVRFCPHCKKKYLRSGNRYEKHVAECGGEKKPEPEPVIPKPPEKLPSQLLELIRDCRLRRENLLREKELIKVKIAAIDEQIALINRCVDSLHAMQKDMQELAP